MRKYIICFCLLLGVSNLVNAQTWDEDMVVARKIVDSLNNELKSAKREKRIDCLNLLAETYYWIWDNNDRQLDTACVYSNTAYELAKKSNYKKGLGYATLWKAQCIAGRVDDNKNNNGTEVNYIQAEKWSRQAIQIGEEIKDYRLVGDVYDMLKWMERWKGDPKKFNSYVEKAIYYYEKPVTKKLSGLLNISRCNECQGNEKQLGNLYQMLAEIIFAETKNMAAAASHINKAIYYYNMIGQKNALAGIYYALSNAYFRMYDYKSSIESSIKSINFYEQLNQKQDQIQVINEMVKIFETNGDFENGLTYGKRSIQLAEDLYNAKSLRSIASGQAFFWMSRLYKIAGDYETALYFIRRGKNFYPNPIDSLSNAFWSSEIGDVHRLLGNYDSAMYYLKGFENTVNHPNNFGKISLAYLYLNQKDYAKAVSLIIPFYQNLKNINRITPPIAQTLIIAGSASFGEKKYQQALQYEKEAQTYLKQMDGRLLMISNYKLLSDIYQKLNMPDSAYSYLQLHTILKDSLINRQFYFKLNNYKKQAEDEKISGQMKILQKDNLIKQQQLQQQILMQQKNETQLALLNKNSELKDQQLLIKDQQLLLKDQHLKEQEFLRQQKESQLALLNNQNKLKDQQLKQQSLIRKALLAGLLLLLLLGVFIFRSLSLKQKNERLQNEKKQAELQQLSTDLEMQALRAQMNPHFIFNCLSSINKFILKSESRAASDYLTRFSRLIRMVLTNSQLSMIPLSDEIEMLRLYLDMERLRFSNAFDYNIIYANTIEPETIYLPPMLLQPFCENAIWHGLMHKDGHGKLDIVMSLQKRQLQCIISDNGIGRAKASELKSKSGEKQKSFGLKITTERLALFNNENTVRTFYNIEDLIDEEGKVEGTEVTLLIKHKDDVKEPLVKSL